MFGIPELQAVQARRQQMMGDVLPPEAIAEMERHKLIEQPGFEESSFVRNQIGWIDQSSKYWTRELFRTQARALKNEPELMARPDILKMLETHERNMLSPRSGGDAGGAGGFCPRGIWGSVRRRRWSTEPSCW